MHKQRLDQLLTRRGLVATRSQAESWIRLGKVLVHGRVITKPGYFVAEDAEIVLKADEQYVSRAGLKLASVAHGLQLDFSGAVVLDVGSSTGGFTDYALRHGARKVIAVDVGTDQLHPSLQHDPRIELHEQTDIREVALEANQSLGRRRLLPASNSGEVRPGTDSTTPQARRAVHRAETVPRDEPESGGTAVTISHTPDIILMDVSFISLREILPHITRLASPRTKIVAMLKPQFEAGPNAKHKGVIKNDALRRTILKGFEAWAKKYFVITNKADSEVVGSKGNRERFYLLQKIQKG